jgi:hypothetical protein
MLGRLVYLPERPAASVDHPSARLSSQSLACASCSPRLGLSCLYREAVHDALRQVVGVSGEGEEVVNLVMAPPHASTLGAACIAAAACAYMGGLSKYPTHL